MLAERKNCSEGMRYERPFLDKRKHKPFQAIGFRVEFLLCDEGKPVTSLQCDHIFFRMGRSGFKSRQERSGTSEKEF